MRIRPYELNSIETGWFALVGGAMFGVVPRALWARHIVPDDRGRIGLAAKVECGSRGYSAGERVEL